MRPLIAANWKMHGAPSWRSKPKQFRELVRRTRSPHAEFLICPPSLFLADLAKVCQPRQIAVGGQNCHQEIAGAYTGEVSAEMLKAAGADYVIVGHSERRTLFGEGDDLVLAKSIAAHAAGLTAIICVGESRVQREAGDAETVITQQISAAVPSEARAANTVIAYEPVWAIGTGLTPSNDDIENMHAHIRKLLHKRLGDEGLNMRILYGGSVKQANAKAILAIENVNGALIGGASLDMQSFAAIAASVT